MIKGNRGKLKKNLRGNRENNKLKMMRIEEYKKRGNLVYKYFKSIVLLVHKEY